jgi:DNA-directed RNA polymerase specialized sigma24 family protein
VMLRDYEGYSYQEIGEITGLNESQVKVYIYRARTFLKNYIGSLDAVI